MVVFVKIDFWKSPISKFRINEAKSLSNDRKTVRLIKDGLIGDVFFHVVEQDDIRMQGFEKEAGYPFHTIPLAADKIVLQGCFDHTFKSDISFVGTYLPDKRNFFQEFVFPLKDKYQLRLYGQDWTRWERALGWLQRGGQYFNVPWLRALQKPKLKLGDEANIYKSSLISLNIHEQYQREFGGDCNERTFKIPFCEGFEITDNVKCISKYFKEGEEIVIAHSKKEWFEKIDYYYKNPEKRLPIINAGRNNVLMNHTYHNRAEKIIALYHQFKNKHDTAQ
jgi:spore maturation protein CgeB